MLSLSEFFGDPRVVACVSDRSIDFKLNPESASTQLTTPQQSLLAQYAGGFVKDLIQFRQVHGHSCVELSKKFLAQYHLWEADGMMTREANLPLTVRTADCLSVFIYDPQVPGIALVHAGWKGTQQRIVAETLKDMQKKWGSDLTQVKVILGPSIRPCCYEVGPEFKERFVQEIEERDGKLFLNLPLVNQRQLVDLGVSLAQIFDCGWCTACDPRFFSYRREGEAAGRMISLMMLKAE